MYLYIYLLKFILFEIAVPGLLFMCVYGCPVAFQVMSVMMSGTDVNDTVLHSPW